MTNLERVILTSKPVAFLIRKSKEIVIPGFQGLPLFDVVRFFFIQINKIGLNERAAAISFNAIMAIPAACIFLFSIVPYLPVSAQFKTELLSLTKDLTPNQKTYALVETFLNDYFQKTKGGLLSFGILMVIFYSSNAMMGIIRTFDKSILHAKTHFIHKRWKAIKLTILLILLVICSVLFLIGHDALEKILRHYFHFKKENWLWWWEGTRWLLIVLLIFFGISIIYRYAPSVEKKWNFISPGSLLATFLTLVSTIAFSFWVTHFGSYNKVYGSIGTILVIMIVIDFNALILLIGFELNVSITYLKQQVEKRRIEEDSSFSDSLS
ncbi:MAG: YihY/virulence factor BrkB family protein [Bacteroidetes bacterium]|nr:YihY/virulence factor BrkB family protein [Bacteroidota bacterium]